MGHTTHGLQLAGAYLGRSPRAHEAEGRAGHRRRPWPRRDLGRRHPAGRVADGARHRSRRRARANPRPLRRRHPPQPSHRLPRRLPHARHRHGHDGDDRQLRSRRCQRGAVRRPQGRVHARPHRRRHSHRRRSHPHRHERVHHHQRHDQPAAQGGQALSRPLGDGRTRARPPTIPTRSSPIRPARSCRPAARTTATRAMASR